MKVKDPKKRIIMPGESANVEQAVDGLKAKQQIEKNPMFQMMQALRQEVIQVSAQYQSLVIRVQALTDYLAHAGLVLHQDIDNQGHAINAPHTPDTASSKVFEGLVEAGYITMPENGYSVYFIEHSRRTQFLLQVIGALEEGAVDMKQVLAAITQFNADENRLIPIVGAEFGLSRWLTENPDKLSDEELEEIAGQFQIQRIDEPGEELNGDDTEGAEEKAEGSVPTEEPTTL